MFVGDVFKKIIKTTISFVVGVLSFMADAILMVDAT